MRQRKSEKDQAMPSGRAACVILAAEELEERRALEVTSPSGDASHVNGTEEGATRSEGRRIEDGFP